MPGTTIEVQASEGGTFDCYLAVPASTDPTPAIVLACSIDGVDDDLRQIADAFAAAGFIAAAPDLFWRTVAPCPGHKHTDSISRRLRRACRHR